MPLACGAKRWVALALVLLVGCAESTPAPPLPPPPPAVPEGAVPLDTTQTLPASQTSQGEASASAQTAPPAPPAAPSVAPAGAAKAGGPLPELPSQAPRYVAPQETLPPAVQWTATYPTGQWVYANGYGWMWIPNDAGSTVVEGVPYVYLYTPTYGWSWYVSPWGFGGYRYGVWVVHPWRPVGWRYGWVARPAVIVHIGGYYGYGHHGYHGHGSRRR